MQVEPLPKTDKPAFSLWERKNLDLIANELWDENQKLRIANEQLRLNNKDLSNQLRDYLTNKDDWK